MQNLQALRIISAILNSQINDTTLTYAAMRPRKAEKAGRRKDRNTARLLLKLQNIFWKHNINQQ